MSVRNHYFCGLVGVISCCCPLGRHLLLMDKITYPWHRSIWKLPINCVIVLRHVPCWICFIKDTQIPQTTLRFYILNLWTYHLLTSATPCTVTPTKTQPASQVRFFLGSCVARSSSVRLISAFDDFQGVFRRAHSPVCPVRCFGRVV